MILKILNFTKASIFFVKKLNLYIAAIIICTIVRKYFDSFSDSNEKGPQRPIYNNSSSFVICELLTFEKLFVCYFLT